MQIQARVRRTTAKAGQKVEKAGQKVEVRKKTANGDGNGGQGARADSSDLDVRKLLRALQAVRDGDFSVRLASDQTGLAGKVADTFNEIVNSNQHLARELERAGQIVGKDGKTRHRLSIDRRLGAWGAMEASVNTLMDDLLWPTTEVTRTISSVAKGDLSQTMSLEVDGRTDVDPHLAAAGEHVRGPVLAGAEEHAERGRRLGQPVDLLLERDDLVARLPERACQSLVLAGHGRDARLGLAQPLLEQPDMARRIG